MYVLKSYIRNSLGVFPKERIVVSPTAFGYFPVVMNH